MGLTALDPILAYVQARQREITELIRKFVECESPSDSPAAVDRFVELVSDTVAPIAKVKTRQGGSCGRHVVCEMALPGRKKSGKILALGHSDTVWPMGTLRSMPFRQAEGRLRGPGVLDMKSGIVFFLFAVHALRELDIPAPVESVSATEFGRGSGERVSRPLTEKNAAGCKAVLVLEPGTGLAGKLKTARKGVGDFTVEVRGRASHAGVDFEAGTSAVLELARQIERIAGFTAVARGITVNPGVISGGTRSNVVAAEARAVVDIRIFRLKDAPGLEKKFRSLRPFDRRCSIQVTGGLNRPPMERSAGIVKLFREAQKLAREIGVEAGGVADGRRLGWKLYRGNGNPYAGRIGRSGEGAHAANESILEDRIADRSALIAKLLATL